MPNETYSKLTGAEGGAWGRVRLWSGPDHLMEVTSYGFKERYRRFYFREIEALVIQRTSLRRTWNLISGGMAVLCAAGIGAAYWAFERAKASSLEGLVMFFAFLCGVIGVISLVCLLINSLRGPYCICFIKTRVRTERLASPKRLRGALRLAEKLGPLIETAQSGAVAEVPR